MFQMLLERQLLALPSASMCVRLEQMPVARENGVARICLGGQCLATPTAEMCSVVLL